MYQIVEMTHDEQVEMYKHVPLKDLINMLIECNRLLKILGPKIVDDNSKESWNREEVIHLLDQILFEKDLDFDNWIKQNL